MIFWRTWLRPCPPYKEGALWPLPIFAYRVLHGAVAAHGEPGNEVVLPPGRGGEPALGDRLPELQKAGTLPKLYFCCGSADPLIWEKYQIFKAHAKEIGLPAQFEEAEGLKLSSRLDEEGNQPWIRGISSLVR